MEYGDVVRLEVASNLVLSESERNMFLSSFDSIFKFVNRVTIKDGDAKRKGKEPLERIVIPSSILRKDKALASHLLEEICVMPGDIEGRQTFVISPMIGKSGD